MRQSRLPMLLAPLLALATTASGQSVVTSSGFLDGRADLDLMPSRGSNAAMDLLLKPVESVDWFEVTFEEVIDWLKEESGGRVNVVPRWGPLGVESVNRESFVTLQLNNTFVAEVLNEVMDQLSEDGQMSFHGVGNTLKISTRRDFGRKLYVRVYDATDILFRVPNFGQSAPQIDLQNAGQGGGGGGGGGGGQSVFGGGGGGAGQDNEDAGQQAEQRLEQELTRLRELIEQTIEFDTWDVNGGQGRIRVFNRSLVIFNTVEVHEAVGGTFRFEG